MSGYKDFNTISLENFNPNNTREPILTSPRSLEACKRQGIDPSELTVKTLADIKEMYEDSDLDKEGFEMMVEHVEKKRVEKVRLLIKERERLAEDMREGRWSMNKLTFTTTTKQRNHSAATSPKNKKLTLQTILNTKTDSTMIEREKKQLEKIQMRQEKEIKHMIEYEAKMTEVKKAQEEKLAKEKERERRMELERAKAQKESEEKKRARELEDFKREEAEEEERKKLALEAYKREQEFLAMEKEKERRRQLEAKRREEEQRIRHEEFVKKTEEKLLEQKILVEKKKEEMEAKDQVRKEFLEQQALAKQKESEQKRREHEEKLRGAKDKFEEVLLQKKIEFDEKQKKNEERRKLFEAEIERKKEEAKKKAEIHEMNLQRVFEENKKIEEEKKRYYIMRAEMAEERRKELEILAEQERQRKIQEEREREEKRKQIFVNMERMSKEKVETILHSIEEAEERLAKAQKEREKEAQFKKNLDIINKLDKLENVKRMTKVKAYEKERLEDRLEEAYEKANKIKQDREEILEVRKVIRKEMEVSKKVLADKFERVKLGKLNPIEFASEINKNLKKKNGGVLSKISSPPRSLNALPDKPVTMVFFTPQNKKKAESLANLDATYDLSQRVLPSVQSLPYLNNTKRKPKNIKITTKAVANTTVDKAVIIDKLKVKQNEEMLVLLEEEREKECEREAEMENAVDSGRRRRLEEDFKVERGLACSRIEQLANSHEVQLKQTMMKFNIVGEKGN